ncbi:MAG: hypothetical protein GY861_21225 [bacterium]|nr:hypothetical protein [bacterium]
MNSQKEFIVSVIVIGDFSSSFLDSMVTKLLSPKFNTCNVTAHVYGEGVCTAPFSCVKDYCGKDSLKESEAIILFSNPSNKNAVLITCYAADNNIPIRVYSSKFNRYTISSMCGEEAVLVENGVPGWFSVKGMRLIYSAAVNVIAYNVHDLFEWRIVELDNYIIGVSLSSDKKWKLMTVRDINKKIKE